MKVIKAYSFPDRVIYTQTEKNYFYRIWKEGVEGKIKIKRVSAEEWESARERYYNY